MNTCSKCGNTVADDAHFCDKCGTQINNVQNNFCSTCGNQVDASSQLCAKCGAPQKASKTSISASLQKSKNNNRFVVIALCVSLILALVLLPMFSLKMGHITTKDEFVAHSEYTLKMVGENYIAITEYKNFANDLTAVFFIIILAALGATTYFTVTGQKKYSLISAVANLGLLILFVATVSISWAEEGNYYNKAVATMGAGSWISIILSIVLVVYIFNENIFKKIIQKIIKT